MLLVLDRYKLPKHPIRVRYGVTDEVHLRYKYAQHDYQKLPHGYIHGNTPDDIVAEIMGLLPDANPDDIRTTSHRYFPEILTHTRFIHYQRYQTFYAILFAQVGILRRMPDGNLLPIRQIPMTKVISRIQNS